MKTWKQFTFGIIALVLFGFRPTPLCAQEEGQDKPKPAARVLLPLPDINGDQQDDQDAQTMQPDTSPVTGVESPTLGTSEIRHSYWVPGIRYGSTAQSRSINLAEKPGWIDTNYVNGSLSVLEAWGRSLLSVGYSGGGSFSTDTFQGNGQYHQFATALQIDQKKWQALVIDEFSYTPVSSFGLGGATDLAFPGITGALAVPLPGLQTMFVPGQTILSVIGPRYSNASAGQLTYTLSRRGSITVSAVHGFLRFVNSGNLNGDTEILSAGYNYAVSRKDSVGVSYRFTAFHYPGDPQALGDHTAQLMYGRKITGKLALNLGGGPEITNFRIPVNGSKQNISASGMAALVYASRKSTVRLGFAHGVSNGSGLFAGAVTDLVNAGWSRPLTRVWTGNVTVGYSKNRQILSLTGLTSPTFDSWVPGAGLSRPLGRTANFSLGYQAQIQSSNVALCNSPGCATSYTTHQIQMSFQWHAAPQVLR